MRSSWAAAFIGIALMVSACAYAPSAATPADSSPDAGSPSPAAVVTVVRLSPGQTVFVTSADGLGADFRRTPGASGERYRVLPDGAVLTATGQDQQIDGQTWREVRDSTGMTGWVGAASLSTAPPPLPTPTGAQVPPTATSLFIPTVAGATPATAGPRPIDTLVPVGPDRQPPPLVPLPPVPTARPATPTPLRPVRVVPTLIDPSDDGSLIRCQDGTVANTSIGGTCAGHGGVSR